jgi:hypothetical protein
MSAATELAPPTWAEPAYLDPTTGRLVTPAARWPPWRRLSLP